jgi:hypothetical protein
LANRERQSFKDVLDKVLSKVEGWRATTLSQAGRAVLIKSVAATIPSYAMSTFLLLAPSTALLTRFSKISGGVFLKGKPGIYL